MQTWPASFPRPTVSLAAENSANSLRTNMDAGTTRQRRRFTKEQVFARVTWELSDNEFGVFIAYHKHYLNLGNDWFTMNLPLGGGFADHVVRFVDGKFSQDYVEIGYWNVGAILEIQERSVFSLAVLDYFLELGFSESELTNLLVQIDAFHLTVHETLPANLN